MKHVYQIWVWEKIFHADRPNPDLNSLTEEAYNTFFPNVVDPGLVDRTIYDVMDTICGEHNGED